MIESLKIKNHAEGGAKQYSIECVLFYSMYGGGQWWNWNCRGGGSDVITSTVLGIRIECKITDVI